MCWISVSGLPGVSASSRCSKPSTNRLTLFQMCVLHHQMLSTWRPCLKLLQGADSHTGTLCGETIQPLSVFVFCQHSSLLLRKIPPAPSPSCTDTENVQRARREEGKRNSECVAKREIKTRGRKVSKGWKRKCCCWHKTAYCSCGLL